MFNWLTALPQWFQMVFSIAMLIAGAVFVGSLIKRGFSFVFGKLNINTGSPRKSNKNVHSRCKHAKDVIILLNETNKIIVQKMEIRYYETLKQQMGFAEEKATVVEGLLLKVMIGLLQKKNIPSPVEAEVFLGYKVILNVVHNDLINKIRISFRENHYAEMPEMDFLDYVDRKVDFLILSGTSLMNELFYFQDPVSRDELYKANMDKVHELKMHFMEAFMMARKVAMAQQKKLIDLDMRLEELINPWISEV